MEEEIVLAVHEGDSNVRKLPEEPLQPHRAVHAREPASQDEHPPRRVCGNGTAPPPVAVRDERHQQAIENDVPEHALPEDGTEEDERPQEEERQGTHQDPRHDEGTGQSLDEGHPEDEGRGLYPERRHVVGLQNRQHGVRVEAFPVDTEVREIKARQQLQEELGAQAGLALQPSVDLCSPRNGRHRHIV